MRYCVINGSPRGKSGNTEILLKKIAEGISTAGAAEIEWLYLNDAKAQDSAEAVFSTADVIILGFPLYTDAMPGLVKVFIESWEPYTNREGNPRLAFVVQSGFPEAHHSRFVEHYLEKLARRMMAPYAGTLIKGGCEGLRRQPQEATLNLFAALNRLGEELARTGVFDRDQLRALAQPEKYPRILAPLFWLILRMPFTQAYWDKQLRKNGAFEQRFDRPFINKN